MNDRLKQVVVSPSLPIADAIRVMDRAGLGVLLLCDAQGHLVGILTDGDVRRAILRNVPMNAACEAVAGRNPVTAPVGIGRREALHSMDQGQPNGVNQLPLLDTQGRVKGLILRTDLASEDTLGLEAVVMAGGVGSRLRPLTEHLPKPMLPVGDKPILQHIVEQLRDVGIRRIHIATHYREDKIRGHFGDGKKFGVDIQYVREDRPLGTAGSLGLVERTRAPMLIMNGDILTDVNFRAMLDFHRENRAALTVAVRKYDVGIPYGVVECEGCEVKRIAEKPTHQFLVNAGIYLLEPVELGDMLEGTRVDMTDVIERLIARGRKVVSFPVMEYWLDVGRPADYEKAQEDLASRKVRM